MLIYLSLLSLTGLRLSSVKDFMRKDELLTVKPEELTINAIKKMKERNVGSVLVVSEEGKLVGIFTERDVLRLVAEGKPLDKPISEYMSKKLITALLTDSLSKVASIMVEKWIRHLPVVDERGKVVGIISIRDVLRYIVSSSEFP